MANKPGNFTPIGKESFARCSAKGTSRSRAASVVAVRARWNVAEQRMILLDGRERTEGDFRELFARAGLRLTRIVATSTLLSIVEGERA